MGLVIDRALTSLYQVTGDFYGSRVLSFVGKRERERDIDTMFLGSGTCNRFSMVFVVEETWWSIMLGGQLC